MPMKFNKVLFKMKKIFMMLSAVIALASCNNSGYKIDGEVENFSEGAKVILYLDSENGFTKVDSTVIKDKKFSFKGERESVEYSLIQIEEDPNEFPFQIQLILEKGQINVSGDKNDIKKNKVTGTQNNEDLQKFNNEMIKVNGEIEKMQADLESKAEGEHDYTAIIALQQETQKKVFDVINTFINGNKNSFVSLYLLNTLSGAISLEELKEKFNMLSAEVKETRMGKQFADKLKSIGATEIGQKAPEFKILGTDRKTQYSLYDNLGKATIIDFWASWCPPCREANPKIVKLYEKYKDKGLQIIGVSLDTDEGKWKGAIEKDGLTWLQLASLEKKDKTAVLYNIDYIPTLYLLDEKGTIVAKNIHDEELENKIVELLK